MRKRNRSYKPKTMPIEATPVMYGLSQETRNQLYLMPLSFLDAMYQGEGSEEKANTLNSSCQLAEIVSRTDKPLIQEACKAACLYAAAVVINGEAGFGWKVDDIQYKGIGIALRYLAEVQEAIPRREMNQHIQTLYRENDERLKQTQGL